MPKTRFALAALALGVTYLLATAAPALAWGNGLNGASFGTHDWLQYWSTQFARREGVVWINIGLADAHSSDPDFIIGDEPNHNYERWHGHHKGHADLNVRKWYNRAVADLKAGRTRQATIDIADMVHYYVDMNQPLHTQSNRRETADLHGFYEADVDAMLRSPGAHTNWLKYDGYQHVPDPRKFAVQAAARANKYYMTLLNHYIAHGMDSTVRQITITQLNRAANGAADLICSVQQDAALRGRSGDIGADVGMASDGTNYYAVSSDAIQKFNAKFASVAATSGLTSGVTSITTPVVGAGCIAKGQLYVPVTDTSPTVSVWILVFDPTTLTRVNAIQTSMTAEVSAIAYVPNVGTHGTFYAATRTPGAPLLMLDGATWSQTGTRPLNPKIAGTITALAYYKGALWAGTSPTWAYGRVFHVTLSGQTHIAYVHNSAGNYKGFAWRGSHLVWLVDAGPGNRRVLWLHWH
jgi:hypothetical protein